MVSEISKKAKKFMVIVVDKSDSNEKFMAIVVDKSDSNAYCNGCVMAKDSSIVVIVPSKFVQGRDKRLKVIFFDKTELDAKLVGTEGPFSSLETSFHSGCEKISLLEDDHPVEPQHSFNYVRSFVCYYDPEEAYISHGVESVEAYPFIEYNMTLDSQKYFLVSCEYFEKTAAGVNRLTAAPVFDMLGRTAGIVLQDCRHGEADPGREMKVALKARYLRELMISLNPPAPPGELRGKRKRNHR